MSDPFEDRLAALRPAPVPPELWERARTGRTVRSRHVFFAAAAAALAATLALVLFLPPRRSAVTGESGLGPSSPAVGDALSAYPHRLLFETRRDGNWEIYRSAADGSGPVNLTRTPDVDELYPKASPDGTRIAFVADQGSSERRRSLWVMNADGSGRRKIADRGREPCWSPDGTRLAYVKGERDELSLADFATRGLFIHDFASGRETPHPNAELQHLYTLTWSPDGLWFIATVHGALGFAHGIVAIQADGPRVVDLGVESCCRPDLSADGTRIAWGRGDYAIAAGDVAWTSEGPRVSNVRDLILSRDPLETYHVDWSPDGRYVAFSFGPKSRTKSLQGLLPEFPGVEAPDWNVGVADASGLNRWTPSTNDGRSNKEPDWLPEARK
jgi:Tol biopolymer transport system component